MDPSRSRRLRLDGPHLRASKKVRPDLEQTQRYASELGTQFAVLTNGDQLVLFQTYRPGVSWDKASALVFHDYRDIQEHFADFYALLSRDAVIAGSLTATFEQIDSITTPLYAPLETLRDPDRELVRNPFWQRIASVLGPLLSDNPDNPELQSEIIANCYVTTPLSDQADRSLDLLVRDAVPEFLSEANLVSIVPSAGGRDAFSHQLEDDVKVRRPRTYILTGGVGSGKTTFLRRFVSVVAPAFVERFCVWLHVDFLSIGAVDESSIAEDIASFTYGLIRQQLADRYADKIPADGPGIRELFGRQLSDLIKTRLHGVREDAPEWTTVVNLAVEGLYRDDREFVSECLRLIATSGLRIVIVLDNTDQLGERFQEAVFLFAQRLSADLRALCVVALREEKFFAAYRAGVLDAYGDRRFHIGSPHIAHVIRARLSYGIRQIAERGTIPDRDTLATVQRILSSMLRSTTKRESPIARMLACVSGGDIRYALDMYRQFVSSGNTDFAKIERILTESGSYDVPFHEFAKSAILGTRRFYRGSLSHIVNAFARSSAAGASHLTACRILARLAAAEGAASKHGAGFVDTTKLLREYRESYGQTADFSQRAEELLRRGLIEAEPPKIGSIERSDACRISASGAYYWRYLIPSFAYVDLVLVDTPIDDQRLARELAELSEDTDLMQRLRRVAKFMSYLHAREDAEQVEVGRRGGVYRANLIPLISQGMEAEVATITRKAKKYGGS